MFYTSIFHNLYLKILFSFSKSKPMIIKEFDVHRFFSVFFILYYLSNKSSNTIKLKHLFFCAKNFHLTIFQSFLLNPTKTAFTFSTKTAFTFCIAFLGSSCYNNLLKKQVLFGKNIKMRGEIMDGSSGSRSTDMVFIYCQNFATTHRLYSDRLMLPLYMNHHCPFLKLHYIGARRV